MSEGCLCIYLCILGGWRGRRTAWERRGDISTEMRLLGGEEREEASTGCVRSGSTGMDVTTRRRLEGEVYTFGGGYVQRGTLRARWSHPIPWSYPPTEDCRDRAGERLFWRESSGLEGTDSEWIRVGGASSLFGGAKADFSPEPMVAMGCGSGGFKERRAIGMGRGLDGGRRPTGNGAATGGTGDGDPRVRRDMATSPSRTSWVRK